jgi:4-amino-4-deoxy-L-arabinose transferase-like glycosyltransferase
MFGKFALLLIVYGGPSVAALLVLLMGAAIARTRTEVRVVAAISGALVLVHAGELVFLAGLGEQWMGDGVDPLLVAGVALMLLAGAATAVFLGRRGRQDHEGRFSDDMR